MDIEILAEKVHQAYLDTCAKLGWDVKPENQVAYSELSDNSKELDRASVWAVLSALPNVESTEKSDNKSSFQFPELEEVVDKVARDRPGDYYVMTGDREKTIKKVYNIIVGN